MRWETIHNLFLKYKFIKKKDNKFKYINQKKIFNKIKI